MRLALEFLHKVTYGYFRIHLNFSTNRTSLFYGLRAVGNKGHGQRGFRGLAGA